MSFFKILTAMFGMLFLSVERVSAGEAVLGSALGATTCGTSTCHAAKEPWPNSSVTQREYISWKEKDPHSGAYATLTSERAGRIARLSGQGDPTRSSKCLGCHAFNVPEDKRGDKFDISEGVTCEACHGPASAWLGVHMAGLYYYGKNLEMGMYPITDPAARAKLCLSCHVGDTENFVDHSMMAAGHPVLPFELGYYTWFTKSNPSDRSGYAHFEVDDDYLQRKPWPFGVKVWAIGQVAQAKRVLDLVTDPKYGPRGLFPELAHFDCRSCHRSIQGSGVSGPALPEIKTANLLLSELVAELVDDRLATRLRSDIESLRAATRTSWRAVIDASHRLKSTLGEIEEALSNYKFTIEDNKTTLTRIATDYASGRLIGYETSEQAVLAAGALVDELNRLDALSAPDAAAALAAAERGLAAFKNQDVYSSQAVRESLQNIVSIIAK